MQQLIIYGKDDLFGSMLAAARLIDHDMLPTLANLKLLHITLANGATLAQVKNEI